MKLYLCLCLLMAVGLHAKTLDLKERELLKELMDEIRKSETAHERAVDSGAENSFESGNNSQDDKSVESGNSSQEENSVEPGNGSWEANHSGSGDGGNPWPAQSSRPASTILYPGIGFNMPPFIGQEYAELLELKTQLTTAEAMDYYGEINRLIHELKQEFHDLATQVNNPGPITANTFPYAVKHVMQLWMIGEMELMPRMMRAIKDNTYMGTRAVIAGTDEVNPKTGEPMEAPCDNLVCSLNKVAMLVTVTDMLTKGGDKYMREWNYVLPCDMLKNTLEASAVSGKLNPHEIFGALQTTLDCRISNINSIVYGFDPVTGSKGPNAWLPHLIVPMAMWSHVQLNMLQSEVTSFRNALYFLHYVTNMQQGGASKRSLDHDMNADNLEQEVNNLMERSFNKRSKQFTRRDVN